VGTLQAAAAGFKIAAQTVWEQYREGAVDFGRVVAASPDLHARELGKRAALAATG
jgi:hypothetical protein